MTHTTIQRTGLAALGAAAVALLFANVVGNTAGENGNVAFYFVSLVICGGLALWLFRSVLPRAVEAGTEVAAKRGLMISVLSLLGATVAFWSGVGFILGAAGATLGMAARQRGAKGVAVAALLLGLLAIAANTAVITLDELEV